MCRLFSVCSAVLPFGIFGTEQHLGHFFPNIGIILTANTNGIVCRSDFHLFNTIMFSLCLSFILPRISIVSEQGVSFQMGIYLLNSEWIQFLLPLTFWCCFAFEHINAQYDWLPLSHWISHILKFKVWIFAHKLFSSFVQNCFTSIDHLQLVFLIMLANSIVCLHLDCVCNDASMVIFSWLTCILSYWYSETCSFMA